MIRAILFCLLSASLSAALAGVYKSIGPDGRVEYTDRPVAGAQPLSTGGSPLEAERTDSAGPRVAAPTDAATPALGPYAAFEILLPEPNATVRNDTGDVQVSLIIEPALLPEHQIRLLIDNQPIAGVVPSTQVVLKEVTLGTHTLQAQITDGRSGQVASTNPVTFHLRKPVPESALP
jgi:hypothetical protein